MAAIAATAARARDVTHLELLVYFYIYVYIITLTFIQVNLPTRLQMETSGRVRSGREGRWGLEMGCILSPWFVFIITVSI